MTFDRYEDMLDWIRSLGRDPYELDRRSRKPLRKLFIEQRDERVDLWYDEFQDNLMRSATQVGGIVRIPELLVQLYETGRLFENGDPDHRKKPISYSETLLKDEEVLAGLCRGCEQELRIVIQPSIVFDALGFFKRPVKQFRPPIYKSTAFADFWTSASVTVYTIDLTEDYYDKIELEIEDNGTTVYREWHPLDESDQWVPMPSGNM